MKDSNKVNLVNSIKGDKMELLYVWIKNLDYLFYHHIGFGFCGKYNINFDCTANILSIKKNKGYQDKFYNTGDEETISSLTCIVGENGAGKTSLIEAINEIFRLIYSYKDLKQNEFLLVLKKSDEIKYYNNLIKNDSKELEDINIEAEEGLHVNSYLNNEEKNEKGSKDEKKKEDNINNKVRIQQLKNLKEDLKNLTIVNYSTLFDNSASPLFYGFYSRNSRIVDLTTAGLIKKYAQDFYENFQISSRDRIDIYQSMELKSKVLFYTNLLESDNKLKKFLVENKKYYNSDILRKIIKITPFQLHYDEIHKNRYKEIFSEKKGKLIEKLYNYVNSNSKEFEYRKDKEIVDNSKVLWHIAVAYWLLIIDTLTMDVDLISKSSNEEIEDIEYGKYGNPCDMVVKAIENILAIFPEIEGATSNYVNSLEAFKVFFNSLEDSFYSSVNGGINISLEGNSELIIKLIDSYYNSLRKIAFGEYVSFSFFPRLCSGEQNMLTLFSRLFSLLYDRDNKFNRDFEKTEIRESSSEDGKRTRDDKLAENIILTIDEGETSFHPAWQKKYILTLIDYLNTIFQNKKIQLIITTNNPIILSDVLSQDVIYLKGRGLSYNRETAFGTNILDLYSDNFFIDDGLIGNFAQTKIDNVLEYINGEDKTEDKEKLKILKDSFQFIIDNIGDPNIKMFLQSLYDKKQRLEK